jgi:hypothetical protein
MGETMKGGLSEFWFRCMVKPRLRFRVETVMPIFVRQVAWTDVAVPGATIQLHIKPRRDYLYIISRRK